MTKDMKHIVIWLSVITLILMAVCICYESRHISYIDKSLDKYTKIEREMAEMKVAYKQLSDAVLNKEGYYSHEDFISVVKSNHKEMVKVFRESPSLVSMYDLYYEELTDSINESIKSEKKKKFLGVF